MPDQKLKDFIDPATLQEYRIDPAKIEKLTISDMNDISQALMEVGRRKQLEGGGGCTAMCCTGMCCTG